MFKLDYFLIGLMEIVSHIVQGCTGFGATVVATPVVVGLLGPKAGIPYGTIITIPLLYIWTFLYWKDIQWKTCMKIVLIMMPGLLFGNYLFRTLDPTYAKIFIGAFVSCIAISNIYKVFIKEPRDKAKAEKEGLVYKEAPDTTLKKIFRICCLILGGVVHGAFQIGGSLITVYTLSELKDKSQFRATMVMMWNFINAVNMYNQFSAGAYTAEVMNALVIGFPMAMFGFWVGDKIHHKINKETFLKVVFVLLLIVGGDMFIRSLLILI